jgi:hypothetical protein
VSGAINETPRRKIDAFIKETSRCFGAPPVSIILRRRGVTTMAYDKTNRGALFRNDDKDPSDDKERDYSGSLDVEGTEYWVSGWVKTSKAGKKYLSISVKPKQWKGDGGKKRSPAEDIEDAIPF